MAKVQVGKKIPDFTATATNSKVFSLSNNIGKKYCYLLLPKR